MLKINCGTRDPSHPAASSAPASRGPPAAALHSLTTLFPIRDCIAGRASGPSQVLVKIPHVVTALQSIPPPLKRQEIAMSLVPGFPDRVHYINHEKCEAAFVQGGRVIEDGALTVIANRGRQRGAEMHDMTNHVFIIVDGEADFITGGTMIDPKVISPGQTRGSGIEGGTMYHLTKGDIVAIPAKTPHQWKDTSKSGSGCYYTGDHPT